MTHAKSLITGWASENGVKLSWLASRAGMHNVHLSKCMAGMHVPGPDFRAKLAELTGKIALADVASWGKPE